jgi:Pyruvate/2-oxoacid:ferredoxin oxidoreductase gamma subunit
MGPEQDRAGIRRPKVEHWRTRMTARSVSITFAGSGGAGVMTAGNMLLDAAGRAGWYAYMTRSSGAQIRGGEAAAMMRLSTSPVQSHDDHFDVLVAIDWQNVGRFSAEIPMTTDGLVLGDPDGGEFPEQIGAKGTRSADIPFKKMAKEIEGGRPNMIALGAVAGLVGLPEDAVLGVVRDSLAKKGEAARTASEASVRAGMAFAAGLPALPPPGHCRGPERAPVEHHRQRGRRPRRGARRHPLRRRLPDHPGHRGAGVARTQPRQARRRAGAGRGRTRLDQPDHRRLLRRRALADRHLRPRPGADDRIARPRGRLRDADHRGQRDARRPLHRHPGQVRAERPQHRALRPARRRPAPGGGAQLARRLRVHHPVGGPSRRQPADRRDRALRPVPGTEPGDDLAARRSGLARGPPDARGRGRPNATAATPTPRRASRRWPCPA